MKHFFERIRSKALDASQAPVLIVAMGDSVTQGVMEHRLLSGNQVYHRVLQEKLEFFFPTTTFSTINAGASGESALLGGKRLERDVLRHDPDLVILAFGLNDSLGGAGGRSSFSTALRDMVRRIRESTQAVVLLMTPPMMAKNQSFRIHRDHAQIGQRIIAAQCDGSLGSYAETIREIALDTDSVLVDVHLAWSRLAERRVDTDLWLSNGLNHPDSRGHQLAADLIFQCILSRIDAA